MNQKQFQTENADETKLLAEQLAKSFKGGEVLLLVGELGAGKTTFVQGLGVALGVRGTIKSPSYTLVSEHEVHDKDIQKLVHVDAYRLEEGSAIELGLDISSGSDTVLAIEWPQNLKFDLPECEVTHEIRIDHVDGDKRKVTIKTDRDFQIDHPFGPPDEHAYRYKKTGE